MQEPQIVQPGQRKEQKLKFVAENAKVCIEEIAY